MVDACTSAGILPFYGPYGDIKDVAGLRDAVPRRLPARLRRRLVAAPGPDRDREEGLQPDPDEVKFAKKVIEAIPDGRGVHMIDGKMQDDATWKQCKVMVELAEMLAKKDPELAEGVRALIARWPSSDTRSGSARTSATRRATSSTPTTSPTSTSR